MLLPLFFRRTRDLLRLEALPFRLLSSAALLVVAGSALPPSAGAQAVDTRVPGDSAQAFAQDFSRLIAAIPQARINTEPKTRALQGLGLLGKARLEEGSVLLNSALKLDPSNSYLQFFNAFAYHLMAQRGDTQKFSLAEQGYALAIQFDRSNWIAHYFLGVMHFEQRNYHAAQSELAEVMLFREDDRDVLSKMVAASYYSGDPVTAAACLDRLHQLDPGDAPVLRMLAIVTAAMGRAEEAQRWLAQYQATRPAVIEFDNTQERINHWSVVYRNAPGNMLAVQLAPPNSRPAPRRPAPAEDALPALTPPVTGTVSPAIQNSNNMVLVDVVLMYTVDTLATNKGVNLLKMLTLQFGSNFAPAFSKVFSSADKGSAVESTAELTRIITVPALTYSLNIANSSGELNEVLARPTLVALDGVKSEFFSGETLNAAVVSSGSIGGGAVQIEKEVGFKLGITPRFLPDGRIRMSVNAERTFLKPASADIVYTYKLATKKVMINANVVMNFGETLVLGGLNEKETFHTRDGAPLLQDIPGLQYLFSNKHTNDYQHSVLMLITPRQPQYTFRADTATGADTGGSADVASMKEFRARYGDWFVPYPNLSSVFNQLNSSSMYREFRTGDVTLEKWDKHETTLQRLKQALGFLFY